MAESDHVLTTFDKLLIADVRKSQGAAGNDLSSWSDQQVYNAWLRPLPKQDVFIDLD